MIASYSQAKTETQDALKKLGFEISSDAMAPLKKIDFSELVSVMDHNERFLRDTFIRSLDAAVRARSKAPALAPGSTDMSDRKGRTLKVTRADVKTALLMLGAAVEAADPRAFDEVDKKHVKSSCLYCGYGRAPK